MAAPKGNGRRSRKAAPAKTHTKHGRKSKSKSTFWLGDNMRHIRAIQALLTRPITRENLDGIAGCSNGPDLISEFRSRGLEVPCERVPFIDRDGKPCRPGVYSLTQRDRRQIYSWLAKHGKGGRG